MTGDLHALNLQLAPMTARMVAVHSLGMLGEADAALEHIRAWQAAMERQGANRFKGRPANFKAWVLRALGLFEQAHELNLQALEEARGLGTGEAEAHALLDLADSQLRLGHLESAARYLDDAAPLQSRQHANRWRHELRYRLLRSRLAMAQGRSEEAYNVARKLSGDARKIGALRYADLAFLHEVQAAAALGDPPDDATTEAILQRLAEHSGLEAWWLTAEVAAAFEVDIFFNLAEAYACRLAEHAGNHADTFRDYARAYLEKIRAVATNR
jgi:hypothetical protein